MSKLSETQKQLRDFKKRNAHMLGGVKDSVILQVWRDGYVCGAIHGYDKRMQIEKKQAEASRRKEQMKKIRERKKAQMKKIREGQKRAAKNLKGYRPAAGRVEHVDGYESETPA